jgi:hypothetical protein
LPDPFTIISKVSPAGVSYSITTVNCDIIYIISQLTVVNVNDTPAGLTFEKQNQYVVPKESYQNNNYYKKVSCEQIYSQKGVIYFSQKRVAN